MHATHPAASVACPLSLPLFPTAHPWHKANEDDPLIADHRPSGQFPQSSTTLAPNVVTYRPAGQAVQTGFLPYIPLSHGSMQVQASAMFVGFKPSVQSLHVLCPA
jgi:hypothetical protein